MIKIIIPLAVSLVALIFVLWLLFNKRAKSWDMMSEDERRRKKALVSGGILVFLAGIITAIFMGRKEKN
jgi:Na+/H+ antiporter NhaD/arsenite permease-like protein